ncbi:MAG TPA: LPS export ABC transporter permease LptF [Aquabacterium sp.]|nr:LPS export ABC transporter permease LptF [Aquabacterium sp.]
MLFDSSVRKELWRSFMGTLVVLLTVVLTMVLIRVLSQATVGAFAPADVGLILSYTLIGQMPVMVALALFVSVIVVLNRLWRESEMVVWQSSGARQFNFLRPLLRMAWPVLVGVGILTLVARPWGQGQSQQLKNRFERRSDISRVAPGQFQASADGRRVFFIDSHSDGERTGKNVFMVISENGREAVVTAKEGQITLEKNQRYLVLTGGERTQTDLQTGEKILSRFQEAKILVGEAPDEQSTTPDVRSLPTLDLLRSDDRGRKAELVWRLGLIWATLNMVLSGLSLAAGSARRNSNWNMVFALLVFVVYFNLLTLTQTWVAKGKLGWVAALLVVHGGLTLFALGLIWWRDGASLKRRPFIRRAGPVLTNLIKRPSSRRS